MPVPRHRTNTVLLFLTSLPVWQHRICTVLLGGVAAVDSGSVWSSHARPYTATFARHETFHPRYGWLKKGVELIDHNPAAFASDDAHMDLGVGKNMAHAIRYWCEAFGLIAPLPSFAASEGGPEGGGGQRNRAGHQVTTTARDLIAAPQAEATRSQAFDPFLESTATLWWLHYSLIKTQKATTWNFVIDHFGRPSFAAEQLLEDLKRFVQVTYPEHKVAESSLAKDVQLFLRMYSYDERAPFHEDSIDSPFVELGLLNKRGEVYSFVTGSKPTLPDAVIAAAVLDFSHGRLLRPSSVSRSESAVEAPASGPKSISFTELMSADRSPVKAFRLTENALYDALERVAEREKSLFLSDTAGVKQLSWKGEPQKIAYQLLKKYYNHALS